MEFSSLKFGVPSFFVLNKTERGATLSLILLEIYRLKSGIIFYIEADFKIRTLSFKTFVLSFSIYRCVVKLLSERKILTDYQFVHEELFLKL